MNIYDPPRTPEQIASARAELLRPWYSRWFGYVFWIGVVWLVIFIYSSFSIRRDDEYQMLQRKAEERDALVADYATGARTDLFRDLQTYWSEDVARIANEKH